jgi:signal transduction histidine kinase
MANQLSALSHDLRAPLTALKMATTLLARRRSGVDVDEEALLSLMERSIGRLEAIADEMANLAASGAPQPHGQTTAGAQHSEAAQPIERGQAALKQRVAEATDLQTKRNHYGERGRD